MDNSNQQLGSAPVAPAPVGAPMASVSTPMGTQDNNGNSGKSNKKVALIVLAVFGGIFILIVIFVIWLFLNISNFIGKQFDEANSLVCTSSSKNISIYYDEDGNLVGYKASNFDFDLDDEKELSDRKGIKNYLDEYAKTFEDNYGGSCKKNGYAFDGDNNNGSGSNSGGGTSSDTEKQTVGTEEYGYVDVPKNWARFYDMSGGDSFQYAYANTYIVTLYNFGKMDISTSEMAERYVASVDDGSQVLKETKVKIGRNKQYDAYKIDFYYPEDKVYLSIYLFETEDGEQHYIAIEGPSDYEDYFWVPESFSLTK